MKHFHTSCALIFIMCLIFSKQCVSLPIPHSRLSHTKSFFYILKSHEPISKKIQHFLMLRKGICHGCAKTLLINNPKNISTFIKSPKFIQHAFFHQRIEKRRAQNIHDSHFMTTSTIYYDFKNHLSQIWNLHSQRMILRLIRTKNKIRKSHSLYVDATQMTFYCSEKGLFHCVSQDELTSIIIQSYSFQTVVCEVLQDSEGILHDTKVKK